MDDKLIMNTCEDFAEALASGTSVPGGGSASALVGALGASLCSMAGAFTVGRPRHAAVEDEVRALMDEAADVRARLLELVDEDALGFLELGRAMSLSKDDPTRDEALQKATAGACMAPLAMMGECARAIVLLESMGEHCSRMMLSDIACGAVLVRASLEAASLNVYVNTSALRDRVHAEAIESSCGELIEDFVPRAQALALRMTERIGQRTVELLAASKEA